MSTAIRLVSALVVTLAAPLAAVAQAPSSDAKAVAASATPQAPAAAGKLEDRLWWNRKELASELSLTDSQRQGMNEKFRASFTKQREFRAKAHEAREALEAKVSAKNWDEARSLSKQLAGYQHEILVLEIDARIDTLSQLTPEQLTLLEKSHPRLMHATPAGSGGLGGMPRGGPRGGPRPAGAGVRTPH